MREIKFRAWDGERLRKVNTIGWVDEGVDFVTTPRYSGPAEDFSLMQYTGLKDKNGVEIYEGDIVKIDDYFNGEMNAKVVFEKGSFGFVGIDRRVIEVVNSNWNDDFLSASYLSWTYDHPGNELLNAIVIGNVYENPELLEREPQ